jgi:periplasmic divalent cation tolerance protein
MRNWDSIAASRLPLSETLGRQVMIVGGKNRVVLVTCGTLTEAKHIARVVVTKRLAACVNVVLSPVESVYLWKHKVEKAREVLLLIKTTANLLASLEREVKHLHSYDVPEFIALPIAAGSREYLSWLGECVKPPAR